MSDLKKQDFQNTQESAVYGCSDSQLALAKHHFGGTEHAKQDTSYAFTMLCKAALTGHVEATMFLANLFTTGFTGADGVSIERDILAALNLYRNCSGDTSSFIKISDLYLDQEFQKLQHIDQAEGERLSFAHMETASSLGNTEAMYLQGMMHKEGKATCSNIPMAQYMLVKAANMGHKAANDELRANLHIYY